VRLETECVRKKAETDFASFCTDCLRFNRVEFALRPASVLPHGAFVVGASQIN
jgi:hypothetical protein